MEMLLLRRIYRAPELFQLLATFGVVLVVQEAALYVWGPADHTLPRPRWLREALTRASRLSAGDRHSDARTRLRPTQKRRKSPAS